jgi:hypothetical protein
MIDENIISNIEQNYKVFRFNSHYNKPKLYRFFSTFVTQRIKLYFFTKKYLSNAKIYGNDYGNNFDLFRRYPYYLLEDGTVNYTLNDQSLQKNSIRVAIRNFLRGYHKNKPFGLSKNCKKIYLTGLAPIPSIIKNKVEIIDPKDLWNNKTENEQEEILNLLNFEKRFILEIQQRPYILLTQALSEDGYITESEKIELYKKVLSKYDLAKVIIKTHPRETTDYTKVFNKVLVIDKPFPFEILQLLDVPIKKIITLFSTAALDMGNEVDWIGTTVHPKLLECFGNLDNMAKKGKK